MWHTILWGLLLLKAKKENSLSFPLIASSAVGIAYPIVASRAGRAIIFRPLFRKPPIAAPQPPRPRTRLTLVFRIMDVVYQGVTKAAKDLVTNLFRNGVSHINPVLPTVPRILVIGSSGDGKTSNVLPSLLGGILGPISAHRPSASSQDNSVNAEAPANEPDDERAGPTVKKRKTTGTRVPRPVYYVCDEGPVDNNATMKSRFERGMAAVADTFKGQVVNFTDLQALLEQEDIPLRGAVIVIEDLDLLTVQVSSSVATKRLNLLSTLVNKYANAQGITLITTTQSHGEDRTSAQGKRNMQLKRGHNVYIGTTESIKYLGNQQRGDNDTLGAAMTLSRAIQEAINVIRQGGESKDESDNAEVIQTNDIISIPWIVRLHNNKDSLLAVPISETTTPAQ